MRTWASLGALVVGMSMTGLLGTGLILVRGFTIPGSEQPDGPALAWLFIVALGGAWLTVNAMHGCEAEAARKRREREEKAKPSAEVLRLDDYRHDDEGGPSAA